MYVHMQELTISGVIAIQNLLVVITIGHLMTIVQDLV